MGDVISLEKRIVPDVTDFVSFYEERPLSPHRHIGLVLGITWIASENPLATLWVLGANQVVFIPLSACRKLSPRRVTRGLMGLCATGPRYGGKRVVREVYMEGALHVILSDKDGVKSLPIPIQELKFCM